MKYFNHTLPHGGKLLFVKNKISKTTLINIKFDCGARVDTIAGLSHFVEHMFFTGTDKLSKEEVNKKYFDFRQVNASTNTSRIGFDGNIFTHELKNYLAMVCEMITKSTFDKTAVEKEIPVVTQEIVRSRDKYRKHFTMLSNYNLYGLDCYKNTTLGNEKSVGSITSKDVKDYVNKWFVAENLEVYVSSPLPFNKVKKLVVEELESKLSTNEKFEKLELFNPDVVSDDFYVVKKEKIDKCYISVNFTFDRNYKEIEYVQKAYVMRSMMNDYAEGIMKDMRLNKSLVYGGGFSSAFNINNSSITFETDCEEKNVNEVLKTLADYIKGILKTGFTEELLKKTLENEDYKEAIEEPRTSKFFF